MRAILLVPLAATVAGVAGGAPRTAPFAASVSPVRAVDIRYSHHPGCPIGPRQLRLVRLSYWGFDGRPQAGRIVVGRRVAGDVVRVFRRLYRARFPIRRMVPVSAYRGSDDRSMAADNTSGFNCRYAVASGPRRWSAHAYGEAIDVNPVENPYVLGERARPASGSRYLDRSRRRRGMAVSGGVLVRAFASVGWTWGGRWAASPDYQHFSATAG